MKGLDLNFGEDKYRLLPSRFPDRELGRYVTCRQTAPQETAASETMGRHARLHEMVTEWNHGLLASSTIQKVVHTPAVLVRQPQRIRCTFHSKDDRSIH